MRLLPLVLIAALVLAGCSQSASEPDKTLADFDAVAPTGTLRGVVVDDAIRPIANATVTLDGQDPARVIVTDDKGQFAFPDLLPGAYIVRASKVGFFETQVATTVVSGGETPAIKLVLSVDVRTAPAASLYVFNGFLKCSVTLVAARAAACNPNEAMAPICALPLGICNTGPRNITDDQFMALHTIGQSNISFLQSEMQWKDTANGLGKNLRAIPGARTPGDGKLGDYRAFEGPAPLIMPVPGALANALLLGNGRDYVVRVFSSQMDGTAPPCLPAPVNCQWGVGLVFQQQFTIFSHVFYNTMPPEGWQFGRDGDPPLQ